MRGLKRLRSARIIAAGHAFIQNLRRGHSDVVADEPPLARVRTRLRPSRSLHRSGVPPALTPGQDHPTFNQRNRAPSDARLAVVKS
jgi:hypothetical protein